MGVLGSFCAFISIFACSLDTRTIGQSNSRQTARLAVERVAPPGAAHRLMTAAGRIETGQRKLSTSHVCHASPVGAVRRDNVGSCARGAIPKLVVHIESTCCLPDPSVNIIINKGRPSFWVHTLPSCADDAPAPRRVLKDQTKGKKKKTNMFD